MHDEDSTIGLSVKNPGGQSWTVYGDKRALDTVNDDNKRRRVSLVQVSADEIYKAYQTKVALSPTNYWSWNHAPTLESARSHQTLAPLFTFENKRRTAITNRKEWNFQRGWWPRSSALECKSSGWWNYRITVDGVQNIVPWTSITAITPRLSNAFVYYRSPDGGILEVEHRGGPWIGGPGSPPIFKAVLFTPLAAITFDEGKEASKTNPKGIKLADGGINRFAFTTSMSTTSFGSTATQVVKVTGSLEGWVI